MPDLADMKRAARLTRSVIVNDEAALAAEKIISRFGPVEKGMISISETEDTEGAISVPSDVEGAITMDDTDG